VKPGRIMFEIAGVSEEVAREALRLAKERMNSKNVYYLNPSFDTPSK